MNLDNLTKEQREAAEALKKALNYNIDCPELTAALDRLVSAIPRHEPIEKELEGKYTITNVDSVDIMITGPVSITKRQFDTGLYWGVFRALTSEEREAALKALE